MWIPRTTRTSARRHLRQNTWSRPGAFGRPALVAVVPLAYATSGILPTVLPHDSFAVPGSANSLQD